MKMCPCSVRSYHASSLPENTKSHLVLISKVFCLGQGQAGCRSTRGMTNKCCLFSKEIQSKIRNARTPKAKATPSSITRPGYQRFLHLAATGGYDPRLAKTLQTNDFLYSYAGTLLRFGHIDSCLNKLAVPSNSKMLVHCIVISQSGWEETQMKDMKAPPSQDIKSSLSL